ncbi:hypothetical protein BU23DRAFT_574061 [Bimuria novae-zelandiae CBS 107.79]|uniref:Mid2 domain-containing protein n=1 Tax=Bimuria novae-zelandiae CBS 107.79 TaxID=1447943 RepID=A0A6A5UNM0_9PLEO|nr:hypothetical protein BU23DRAFT_574061 [Bimuria novae-zelandiae CBS 107.79]
MTHARVKAAYAFLLLYGRVRSLTANSLCYFPNGKQLHDYTPCNQKAGVSHCCKKTDACINNGYCFQQGRERFAYGLRIARSSCTDRSFDSPACPQYCKDVSSDTDMALMLVNNSAVGGFCCSKEFDSATFTCGSPTLGSDKPFELDTGQIIWDRSSGDTDARNFETVTVTIMASTGRSTATSRLTSTETSTATSRIDAPSSNGSKNTTVTIAVAVAVPLAALLLLALVAIRLLMRRSIKKDDRKAMDTSDALEEKEKPNFTSNLPRHSRRAPEIDAQEIYETPPDSQVYELRCNQTPIEVTAVHPIEADGARLLEADGRSVNHSHRITG